MYFVQHLQEIWRISMKKTTKLLQYLMLSITVAAMSAVFMGCNIDPSADDEILAAPLVVQTFPVHESTGADINGTITATFEEPVDPATITELTFMISSGGTDVEGIVTYDVPNRKAVFSPSALLDYDNEYTATLTTGVKNSQNTSMSENSVWTFTTASEGVGPAPVNYGTAATYVILAKTAVSTVPDSAITGDIGLSPAAETYFTGFSQTDATGYATSDQVVGFMYAADMTSPTSLKLTTAVEDMLTAYDDAAGRLTPDELNLGAGAIGGLTLDPGLYKWNTTVTIGSNVTISGGANDTWIFQISGDLALGNAFNVILSDGAQAKNIVWQVTGEVTMGTGSHFEGIVLTKSEVTMNTGATMNGRLLAQTQVALDQATVTEPVQ
jgi:hypothetical protein